MAFVLVGLFPSIKEGLKNIVDAKNDDGLGDVGRVSGQKLGLPKDREGKEKYPQKKITSIKYH